jgi:hypothetical protein
MIQTAGWSKRQLRDAVIQLNDYVADLKGENERMRSFLAEALEHLEWVTDEGPLGEGWKSPKLRKLVDDIDSLVQAAEAVNQASF